MVDRNGHACLTDFGLASITCGINSTPITQVEGYSLRWAAPEVLKGGRVTPEADIFSFGMVVIEVGSCTCPRLFSRVKGEVPPDTRVLL